MTVRRLINTIGLVKYFVVAASVLMVVGCVTTTNQPERVVDLEKAESTHVQAGLGYLRQSDKESARRHFHKALKLNSNSAGAYNGLAIVYQLEEQWERAEEYYRKALAIDSDYSLARNNYGAFLFAQQRYKEAEKQLALVAKDFTYERRFAALLNLGRTQLKLGQTDEAISSFKQTLGINHRVALAHLELADVYFSKGEFTLSKQHLDQFGKVSRQNSRSLWLGVRLERIFGNQDKEASYAMALKNLHPYSAEYLEYKKTAE